IRGNGPFLCEPMNIGAKPLVIRAGPGFQPLINFHPKAWGVVLFKSSAQLVLEGLDVRMSYEAMPKGGGIVPALFSTNSLYVANCRLDNAFGNLNTCDAVLFLNNWCGGRTGVSYPPSASGLHRLENNVLVNRLPINISRRAEGRFAARLDLDMRS